MASNPVPFGRAGVIVIDSGARPTPGVFLASAGVEADQQPAEPERPIETLPATFYRAVLTMDWPLVGHTLPTAVAAGVARDLLEGGPVVGLPDLKALGGDWRVLAYGQCLQVLVEIPYQPSLADLIDRIAMLISDRAGAALAANPRSPGAASIGILAQLATRLSLLPDLPRSDLPARIPDALQITITEESSTPGHPTRTRFRGAAHRQPLQPAPLTSTGPGSGRGREPASRVAVHGNPRAPDIRMPERVESRIPLLIPARSNDLPGSGTPMLHPVTLVWAVEWPATDWAGLLSALVVRRDVSVRSHDPATVASDTDVVDAPGTELFLGSDRIALVLIATSTIGMAARQQDATDARLSHVLTRLQSEPAWWATRAREVFDSLLQDLVVPPRDLLMVARLRHLGLPHPSAVTVASLTFSVPIRVTSLYGFSDPEHAAGVQWYWRHGGVTAWSSPDLLQDRFALSLLIPGAAGELSALERQLARSSVGRLPGILLATTPDGLRITVPGDPDDAWWRALEHEFITAPAPADLPRAADFLRWRVGIWREAGFFIGVAGGRPMHRQAALLTRFLRIPAATVMETESVRSKEVLGKLAPAEAEGPALGAWMRLINRPGALAELLARGTAARLRLPSLETIWQDLTATPSEDRR